MGVQSAPPRPQPSGKVEGFAPHLFRRFLGRGGAVGTSNIGEFRVRFFERSQIAGFELFWPALVRGRRCTQGVTLTSLIFGNCPADVGLGSTTNGPGTANAVQRGPDYSKNRFIWLCPSPGPPTPWDLERNEILFILVSRGLSPGEGANLL